jgi:hypothetical protein
VRQVTAPGRWVWVLAGLLTALALLIPGTRLIDSPGWHAQPPGDSVTVHATPTAAP